MNYCNQKGILCDCATDLGFCKSTACLKDHITNTSTSTTYTEINKSPYKIVNQVELTSECINELQRIWKLIVEEVAEDVVRKIREME